MRIKIEPANGFFVININGWGTGAEYTSYNGAVEVANAIAKHAHNPSGITTIDYQECLTR